MIEVCVCTLVHPGGRVETYPEVVNDACPMHGLMAEIEADSLPHESPTETDSEDRPE